MTSVVPLVVCLLLVRLLLNSWQWFSKLHRFSVAKVCRETERMVARGKKTHTTISLGIEWHCKTKKFKTQNQKHKSVLLTSFFFFFSRSNTTKAHHHHQSRKKTMQLLLQLLYTTKKKRPIKRPKTDASKNKQGSRRIIEACCCCCSALLRTTNRKT